MKYDVLSFEDMENANAIAITLTGTDTVLRIVDIGEFKQAGSNALTLDRSYVQWSSRTGKRLKTKNNASYDVVYKYIDKDTDDVIETSLGDVETCLIPVCVDTSGISLTFEEEYFFSDYDGEPLESILGDIKSTFGEYYVQSEIYSGSAVVAFIKLKNPIEQAYQEYVSTKKRKIDKRKAIHDEMKTLQLKMDYLRKKERQL